MGKAQKVRALPAGQHSNTPTTSNPPPYVAQRSKNFLIPAAGSNDGPVIFYARLS